MSVPESRISNMQSLMTMVGGRVVYGDGAFAQFAAPAPRAVSDWLPIGRYPGYREASLGDRATSIASAGGPLQVLGADGVQWSLGCMCGVL